jgi:hypothetical protein
MSKPGTTMIGNLFLDVRPGDTVWIDKLIQVSVVQHEGSTRVRLQVRAPTSVAVDYVPRARKTDGPKV